VYAYIDFTRDLLPLPRVVLKDYTLKKDSLKAVIPDQQDSSSAAKKAKLDEPSKEDAVVEVESNNADDQLVASYQEICESLQQPGYEIISAPDQVDPEEQTVSIQDENGISMCPLGFMEATLALPTEIYEHLYISVALPNNYGQVDEVPPLPLFSSSPPLEVATLSNNEKEGPSASSPSSPLSVTLFQLNCEYPNCSFVACCRLLASIPTSNITMKRKCTYTLMSLSNHHLKIHSGVQLIEQDGQEYFECPTCVFVAVVSTTDEKSSLSTTLVPLADTQKISRRSAFVKLTCHYTRHLEQNIARAKSSLDPSVYHMLSQFLDNKKKRRLYRVKDKKAVVNKKRSLNPSESVGQDETNPQVNSQAPPSTEDFLDTTATHNDNALLLNHEDVPVPGVKQEVHFIVEDEDNNEDVQYWESDAESDEEETCPLGVPDRMVAEGMVTEGMVRKEWSRVGMV
jgi:hypothetical protein